MYVQLYVSVKARSHVKYLPVLFSTLDFETGSVAEPGAHVMAGCFSASLLHPPVPLSPSQALQGHTVPSRLSRGC